MNITKKNTFLLIIAFLVMVVSLTMSIYSLSNTDNNKGVAQENNNVSTCSIINIRDFNNSMNTSVFIKEPVVQNNSLVYGVSMTEKGAHSQFYFTLVNKGDKELKIDKIHIEGLENYGRYVKVNLVGINENDLLPPYSEVNVKVTTDYEEELEKSEISINNIKITIDYKE